MFREISIGEAAKLSGVKITTIRYYEQIGLMTAAARTEKNRRTFDDNDVRRLKFIRHSRELGFEIEAIKTLLELQDNPDQSCATADQIARARLGDVKHKIRSLTLLQHELEHMIEGCRQNCVNECKVIEALADG